MKRLALLLPLLALAAGCHDLSAGRASGDDPFLATARAILAECRPGAEPPPPGSASRTAAIEFRCGDGFGWEGVPIEGRALNYIGIASFGKPADPADIALVRPYLAHTNADVRNTAVLVLEDWLADLAVPLPADDPALPADLEAAAEARAAEPAPPLPGGDGDDASTLRLLAAMMRTQGPRPERPFAVLTNDIGRLDCWKRVFLLDGDDSALRRVQEMLGVRYDGRDAPRADPAAIRSRWLLAPAVDSGGGTPVRPCHVFPGGEWCRWHAAVGPRLDRLVPREWSGCVLPNPDSIWRSPAATLAGGAAAPVRLDELPAYGGALDWEALSFLEDESVAVALKPLRDLRDVVGRVLSVGIRGYNVRRVAEVREAGLQRGALSAVPIVDEYLLDVLLRLREYLASGGGSVVHDDDTRKALPQLRKERQQFFVRIVRRYEYRHRTELFSFFSHARSSLTARARSWSLT